MLKYSKQIDPFQNIFTSLLNICALLLFIHPVAFFYISRLEQVQCIQAFNLSNSTNRPQTCILHLTPHIRTINLNIFGVLTKWWPATYWLWRVKMSTIVFDTNKFSCLYKTKHSWLLCCICFSEFFSTFLYLKFLVVWALVLLADFVLEFRFEYLWPFWLFIRSVYDSFRYQGLVSGYVLIFQHSMLH